MPEWITPALFILELIHDFKRLIEWLIDIGGL